MTRYLNSDDIFINNWVIDNINELLVNVKVIKCWWKKLIYYINKL